MLKLACIPAYNEESTISDVIREVKKYVDTVVVCDDGSNDKTSVRAEAAGALVIKHEKNLGKGAAMKSLFQYAKESSPEVMITIDGDGQFLPEEIPKLMVPILQKKSDIAIGCRFDDKTEMPSYRKAGNKFLDKITNMASTLSFRDTQSGFRAYSKKAIDAINITTNGFAVDSEILIDASRKGLRISEEKITVVYKTGGKTSTKGAVPHATEVLTSLIEIIALRHPLRYLGIPGLILTIIGVIFSIFVIAIFNDTRYFSIPQTLIAIGALVLGLILLLMSVILFSISKATKNLG